MLEKKICKIQISPLKGGSGIPTTCLSCWPYLTRRCQNRRRPPNPSQPLTSSPRSRALFPTHLFVLSACRYLLSAARLTNHILPFSPSQILITTPLSTTAFTLRVAPRLYHRSAAVFTSSLSAL